MDNELPLKLDLHLSIPEDNILPAGSSSFDYDTSPNMVDDKCKRSAAKPFIRCKQNYHKSVLNLFPSNGKEVEEGLSAEERAMNRFLNGFGYTIPWIFATFFVLVLALFITGFIDHHLKRWLIWGLIGVLWIGSMLGMFGMLKYGVISDHIHSMKLGNKDYSKEICKLKGQKERFKNEVDSLNQIIGDLSNRATVIEKQEREFDGLIADLKGLDDGNRDIHIILDEIHRIFSDSKMFWIENERAHLLTAFYECAQRGKDNKMRRNEYDRFMLRLTKHQQKLFGEWAVFEKLADKHGEIDVEAFQRIVEEVLVKEDNLKDELRREYEQHASREPR